MNFITNKHISKDYVSEYIMEKSGIAFAMLTYYKNEKHIMVLSNVNISESFQKKGHGNELLESVILHARTLGCEYLYLNTIDSKSWITAWYKRRGFVPYREDENGECYMFIKL